MKLQDQVCSLELAKKLKELGVKQESLWWWVDGIENNFSEIRTVPREIKLYNDIDLWSQFQKIFNKYSAFTVTELGEMLKDYGHHPRYEKISKKWHYTQGIASTEVKARAKMLVYLLENSLINLKESK